MIRNCKPDMPETVFGSLVNPIPTRGPGADCAHHITAAPPPRILDGAASLQAVVNTP